MQDDKGLNLSASVDSVSWTAPGSDEQKRTAAWYVIGVATVVLLLVGAFLLHWFTAQWQFWSVAGLGVLIFISLIIVDKKSVSHPSCSVDETGITIDGKTTTYGEFRAFSIENDGQNWVLIMIPRKRFSLGVSVAVPADRGEQIVDIIGEHLPMEGTDLSIADRLSRWLKL
jgi:hypothetical protein